MGKKDLKFEFHWLTDTQADMAYQDIEKRNGRKNESKGGVVEGVGEEFQEERDWFKSRPRILNEAMRERGIDLGNRFHPFDREDADLSEDDIDEMLERWDKEDEADDIHQPEAGPAPEKVDSKIEYAEHIREEVHTLLDISYQKSLGVFIALVRDELNDVIGMIVGYIRQKDKKASVMGYSVRSDVKKQQTMIKLHKLVEKNLLKHGVKEMWATITPDQENTSTLALLEKMRYEQMAEDGEAFHLKINSPVKKRKSPKP